MYVIQTSLMELDQRTPAEGEGRSVTSIASKAGAKHRRNKAFASFKGWKASTFVPRCCRACEPLLMSNPSAEISLVINSQRGAMLEMLYPDNRDLRRKICPMWYTVAWKQPLPCFNVDSSQLQEFRPWEVCVFRGKQRKKIACWSLQSARRRADF